MDDICKKFEDYYKCRCDTKVRIFQPPEEVYTKSHVARVWCAAASCGFLVGMIVTVLLIALLVEK